MWKCTHLHLQGRKRNDEQSQGTVGDVRFINIKKKKNVAKYHTTQATPNQPKYTPKYLKYRYVSAEKSFIWWEYAIKKAIVINRILYKYEKSILIDSQLVTGLCMIWNYEWFEMIDMLDNPMQTYTSQWKRKWSETVSYTLGSSL